MYVPGNFFRLSLGNFLHSPTTALQPYSMYVASDDLYSFKKETNISSKTEILYDTIRIVIATPDEHKLFGT